MNYEHVKTNLAQARTDIQEAAQQVGRAADSVCLIAVSKLHPLQAVEAAAASGQLEFGENHVQEMVAKHAERPDLHWHMIGTLQRNKVKYIAGFVHLIHSVITKEPESILGRVKSRGKLICGVNGKLPGFSYVDEKGVWSGLDVDYCRAIAAAVFGDAKAVDFRPLLAKDRFTSVQNGEVDILMRNTTRTLTRDVTPNISFAPTTFFDGQGIMIRIGAKPNVPNSSPSPSVTSNSAPTTSPSSTITPTPEKSSKSESKDSKSDNQVKSHEDNALSLKELTGKKVCVETGLNATNLESSIKEANIDIESTILPDLDSVLNAYAKGDCDAISSEKSQLAAWRSKLPRPADHKILDISFSKEPLSPVIVANDKSWRDVVTWVVYATFYAEELGISIDNYNIFKDSKNPEVSRFLGTSDSLGIS